MNIQPMQKVIKQIILLIALIILPHISYAQGQGNGPCTILDTVLINDFCLGTTGTITLVPLSDQTTYNYSIDGGSTSPTGTIFPDSIFLNVVPGTYTIWIQEAPNPQCFDTVTINILSPQDPITVVTNVTLDVLCHGDSTGAAEVNAIGGVLPYTYSWFIGANDSVVFSSDSIVYNMPAGTHTVTVTDAYGCSADTLLEVDHVYPPFYVDLDTIQQVQCNGECNGEVILNVSGSAPPYTFNWSSGQNYYGPGPDILLGLCQGGHQVLITDDYGCDTVVSFIIAEPPALSAIAAEWNPITCYGENDGQAYAFGIGGTGSSPSDYTYSWSPIFEINDTIINLTPGWHYVTITDTNGCTKTDSVFLLEPDQLHVDIPDSTAIYSYCLPTYTGTLVAEAYGGTPGYSYSWDNTPQLSDSIYNLHAGIYTVTVFDDRGCLATATFDLDSITNTFIPDSIDATLEHVTCYGDYDGLISINNINSSFSSNPAIAGSQAPYNYSWTGPASFTSINSPIVNGLYEGNYAVTITDANGCSMVFDVDINQPEILEYGVDYTVDESCIGTTGSSCDGWVVLNILGGTGPYFYDNSFSGVFPIPSAFQSPIINDTLISNFCNGSYDMHITDINGCQGYVYPSIPPPFVANIGSLVEVVNLGVSPAIPTTSCFNIADATAWVYNPNSMFNYSWQSDNGGAPSGIILDTSIMYNNFGPNQIYWLVTHYADSASFNVNYTACDVAEDFYVFSPQSIIANETVTNPTCYGDNDGSIVLNPTSSAIPFTFLWDTLSSIPVGNYDLADQFQLAAGVYTVSITDADGCVLVDTFTVNDPNPITATFNVTDVSCNGDSDGAATVIVDPNSGQTPFVYSWISPSSNSNTISGLNGGLYTVTITDDSGFGCSADFDVTIEEPSKILPSVEANSFWGEDASGNPFHIRCNGQSNGSAIASSVGGIGSVTFSWQDAAGNIVSTSQETGPILSAGTYTLYVEDDNGCKENETIILNEPNLILPNITDTLYDFDEDGIGTEVSCFGLFDGWALSSPTGGYPGVQGYSFSWVSSNGQNVSSQALATNLPALFSYTVTVTDMNNCSEFETSSIFTEPLIFQADVTTTNYAGPTHAPFSVNFLDNTSSSDPYTYSWSWQDAVYDMNLDFTENSIGINEVYIVLTNEITGCTDTVSFDIHVQGIPEINNVFTPNSDGINDFFSFEEFGMITISVEIYNRWGQMVYVWDGMDKSWSGVDISGEEVPEGVYFYSLVAKGEDGHYYDEKGSITLLR